ncbi:MAG TPA: RDD family protein [Verrucomicrobiae bacterium]|nr:RDD family protein [Verrucomicrobiae bacterium]
MIRICSKCGALLLDNSDNCSFCDAPPEERSETRAPAAAESAATGAGEPEWRLEVSRRLEEYRARRGHLRPDDSQSGLPFHQPVSLDVQIDDEIREHPRSRPAPRPRQTERVEIRVQSELDFSNAQDDRARPQTALVPVASLGQRRWAGLFDIIFLALTYAAFLGLFRSLGGQITLNKTTAIIYLVIGYLFYALYFSIFITLAGVTPGMQLRGLSIVRLDGSLPETRQLLWRSFGYLLSGATLALGFLWAFWDEDRFTWQDRISQTYVTAAPPVSESDPVEAPAHHTFAHK